MEIFEDLKGQCEVARRQGEALGQAEYELRIWRAYGRQNGRATTLYDYVSGQLTGLDNHALIADLLTLSTDDGRRLDFFIYDLDGRIVADGGFY